MAVVVAEQLELESLADDDLPLRRGGVITASGLNGKLSNLVVSGVIRNSK